MRRALIISALFHAAIVAIVYFGLPDLFKPEPVVSVPVAVEVVMATPEEAKPEAEAKAEGNAEAEAAPWGSLERGSPNQLLH